MAVEDDKLERIGAWQVLLEGTHYVGLEGRQHDLAEVLALASAAAADSDTAAEDDDRDDTQEDAHRYDDDDDTMHAALGGASVPMLESAGVRALLSWLWNKNKK